MFVVLAHCVVYSRYNKLAPLELMQLFSFPSGGLPTEFVSPRIAVSLCLKRIRLLRRGHHETFQLAAA